MDQELRPWRVIACGQASARSNCTWQNCVCGRIEAIMIIDLGVRSRSTATAGAGRRAGMCLQPDDDGGVEGLAAESRVPLEFEGAGGKWPTMQTSRRGEEVRAACATRMVVV